MKQSSIQVGRKKYPAYLDNKVARFKGNAAVKKLLKYVLDNDLSILNNIWVSYVYGEISLEDMMEFKRLTECSISHFEDCFPEIRTVRWIE